jgi:hypothetical protein
VHATARLDALLADLDLGNVETCLPEIRKKCVLADALLGLLLRLSACDLAVARRSKLTLRDCALLVFKSRELEHTESKKSPAGDRALDFTEPAYIAGMEHLIGGLSE